MKFVNTRTADGRLLGALLTESGAIPLTPSDALGDLITVGADLVALGQAALAEPRRSIALNVLRLESPLAQPSAFRDFMSFEQHITSALGRPPADIWYEQPTFYFSNPADLLGPHDDVITFPGSAKFDYELEIGAVIGRGGRDWTPAEAEAAIVGYLLVCDWSARDLQFAEMGGGLGPAKGKDGGTSLGGVLVTPDELEPFRSGLGFDVPFSATVNGVQYPAGNWRDIYWSFGQMISYASRGVTLRSGDLFGSGTVGGGCISETQLTDPRPWLQPGDQVVLDGGILGSIDATVRAGSPPKSLVDTGERSSGIEKVKR